MSTHEIPRRSDLRRASVGEKAIRDAIHAVEAMGAEDRLTDAVVLLGEALNAVADFVDQSKPVIRRRVTPTQEGE
jgi:hypothetical protein